MATIRIKHSEANGLPQVCMKCGGPTVVYVQRKFKWVANSAFHFFVSSFGSSEWSTTIYCPLCVKHMGHWSWRAKLLWIGFAGAVVATIAFMTHRAVNPELNEGLGARDDLFFIWLSVVVGWALVVAFFHARSIHPSEITDDYVTMINVSPVFVEAVRSARDEAARQQRGEDGRKAPSFDHRIG